MNDQERGRIRWRKAGAATAGLMTLMAVSPLWANNLTVSNVALVGQDVSAKTVDVKFDLQWDNSWRSGENWDAAWVFIKFRAPGSNTWEHARLSVVSGDHTAAADSTIDAVSDGRGVFVYRSAPYTGSVSYASTRLRWTYGSNTYDFARGARLDVSVHAVEMVYIPQGAYELGCASGAVVIDRFYKFGGGAYSVSSEAAIAITNLAGGLYYTASGNSGDRGGTIPAAFPKGYNAFYCMKYEVTQGQYVDFLNKLTATQDAARFANTNGYYRHTIAGTTTNRTTSTPDRACNFLSWADGIAYGAWAGLRPMTELEFEKACRGPLASVADEFAWGTTTYTIMTSEAGTTGSGSETANPGTANYYNSTTLNGASRAGIFAKAGSTRASSGATYFGVMDMSGGMIERCVTAGKPEGRAFTGSDGSGALNAAGNATNADWPSASTATGAGLKGAFWAGGSEVCLRVSDRYMAARVETSRRQDMGWRGVRTAP